MYSVRQKGSREKQTVRGRKREQERKRIKVGMKDCVGARWMLESWQKSKKQIRRKLGFIIRYGKKRKYRQKEISR